MKTPSRADAKAKENMPFVRAFPIFGLASAGCGDRIKSLKDACCLERVTL